MSDGEAEDKPWLAAPDVCRQLCLLSESKKTRAIFQRRHKWHPGTVRDPRTGEPFDTESAWSYIHDLLRTGMAEVEVRVLKFPPNKKAFVLFGQCFNGNKIYIKLQFGHDKIFGRSFHISNPEGDENDVD